MWLVLFIATFVFAIASPLDSAEPSFARPIPNIAVRKGSDVSLPCVINNIGEYRVAWIRKLSLLTLHNRLITRNSRYSIRIVGNQTWWLNITDVQESDRGLYSCQINTSPMMTQTGYLEVNASPPDSEVSSFARPIPNITVTKGNAVSLPCVINNIGNYSVAWTCNDTLLTLHNRLITQNYRYSITSVGNQTWWLNITNVQESDSGEYSCQIYTFPMTTQTGYLEVIASPSGSAVPSFARPIYNITVAEGNDASLPCVINSIGNYMMAWMYNRTMLAINNQMITSDSRYSITSVGNHTWWLNITDVQESDRGLYTCQINTLPPMAQTGYLEVNVQTSKNGGCQLYCYTWILLFFVLTFL